MFAEDELHLQSAGTGSRFANIVTILAGVAAIVATVTTFM